MSSNKLKMGKTERRRKKRQEQLEQQAEEMMATKHRRIMPPAPPEAQLVETIRQLNTQLQEMRLEMNEIRNERDFYRDNRRARSHTYRDQGTMTRAEMSEPRPSYSKPDDEGDYYRPDLRSASKFRPESGRPIKDSRHGLDREGRSHKSGRYRETSVFNEAFLAAADRPEYTDSENDESSSESEAEQNVSQATRRKPRSSKPLTSEPICPMPTFDGTGSLEQFRKLFGECCSINGWENQTGMALWLKQCLRGRARDILYDECNSLEIIWERLQGRFGEHLLTQQYRRDLPNRKRRNGESLTQLADDIRKMAGVVYSNVDRAVRENMSIQHFMAALDSPSVQYDLEIQQPASLDEAVHMAQARESYFGRENPWHNTAPSQPKTNNNRQNRSYNQGGRNDIGQLHGPASLPPPVTSTNMTYPQGAYSMPLQTSNWGYPPQTSWSTAAPGAWGQQPQLPYQQPMFSNSPPQQPVFGNNPQQQPNEQQNRQSRAPVCKHCKGNHPSFVCQPCRHCFGPHFDNACPEIRNRRGGNANPISSTGPTGMGAPQAPTPRQ